MLEKLEKVVSVKVSSGLSDALDETIKKSQFERPEFLRALIGSAANFTPPQNAKEEIRVPFISGIEISALNKNLEKVIRNQELHFEICKHHTNKNLECFVGGLIIGAMIVLIWKAA